MSRVLKLAEKLLKEGKMTTDSLITHLAEALEECECGICEKEYRTLYEDNYGMKIDRDLAEEWVKSMAVTDGSDRTHGQKWTVEQTSEVANKISVDWSKFSKISWYVVMNMMYSDMYTVAKSVDKQDDAVFFARMAKSWLCDEDAPDGDEKLFRYYFKVIV